MNHNFAAKGPRQIISSWLHCSSQIIPDVHTSHYMYHLSLTLPTIMKPSLVNMSSSLYSDWRIDASCSLSWHTDSVQLDAQHDTRAKLKGNLIYFLTSRGPTLSPVALLCFTWVPSHSGNVPDLQHLIIKQSKSEQFETVSKCNAQN